MISGKDAKGGMVEQALQNAGLEWDLIGRACRETRDGSRLCGLTGLRHKPGRFTYNHIAEETL